MIGGAAARLLVARMLVCVAFALAATVASATEFQGLTISKIRAVGDYNGTTFDDTLELWFSAPLAMPAGSPCTTTYRVYANAQKSQLVVASYLALTKGKKVTINVDESLPIRAGACEISYIDVEAGTPSP
ncbi:hypothetical protein [Cognatilysobacter terrigena]|uniref:hypothetical protein n=1 Tax=Cognatilysobacter terrigena TaxID=2488749 RepID=UPI00105CA4EC|nr:hypothetical protein [Lysobacter terrigena]